jgi:multidrug efflux pump subunit AcrB
MKASIRWFIDNPAVANLLMVMLILAGVFAISHTRQETLPNVPLDRINIVVQMPQSTPEISERLLCSPIENAVYSVEGLSEVIGSGYEGMCSVQMDVQDGYETRDVVDDVKAAVGAMDNLPVTAKPPQVTELVVRNRVARVILTGDQDALSLYRQGQALRQSLFNSGVVSIVDLDNLPEREIRIAVSRDDLRRHQINLRDIAASLSTSTDAIGSGVMRNSAGDLMLETGADPQVAEDYLPLAVRREGPGVVLRVRDIASVEDGFVEDQIAAWYDGKPAVSLDVYRVGDQQVMAVIDEVHGLIDGANLPGDMALVLWEDEAAQFSSRFELLQSSAIQGLLILAVLLCLFLGIRLAFWVALGIPVAMLGAVAILPITGESINTISLFAFILVLGIVVDDAIIVGESVDEVHREGIKGKKAALEGATRVARPITYAVLTTLIAFAPLLFLPGAEGVLMRVIPLVAMAILALSLFESLWILPSHLGGQSKRKWPTERFFERVSYRLNKNLDDWMFAIYRPAMEKLLLWRAAVVAVFLALFVLCIMLVHSGWLAAVLFSKVESDRVIAEVVFPQGTAPATIRAQVVHLRDSAEKIAKEYASSEDRSGGGTESPSGGYFNGIGAPGSPIKHIFAEQGVSQKISNARDPDAQYRIRVSLQLASDSKIAASDMAVKWRSVNGEIAGATSVRFDANLMPTKPDIHINLFHDDLKTLQDMAGELHWIMASYSGVHEVSNNLSSQRQIMELRLLPQALNLGLSEEVLASQVRDAFYGIEVDRLAEEDREVSVMLKLAQGDATTQWDLEELPIYLPNGEWAPLGALAELTVRQSPAMIGHYMRERNATVTGMVDHHLVSEKQVMASLRRDFLDDMSMRYPGSSWGIAGKPKAALEFVSYLGDSYLIALFAIFFLLTVLFGNYSQPLLVMSAIPFGIVGAFIGHFILGHDITLWSMVGVVAVSGVVVNDNLVLLDCVNHNRANGLNLFDSVLEAGASRFRPILLTSITTFAGMAPLIIDNSLEARFLVPMAVSLAFGVLFATLVSLILVPALMLLANDSKAGALAAVDTLKERLKAWRELRQQNNNLF